MHSNGVFGVESRGIIYSWFLIACTCLCMCNVNGGFVFFLYGIRKRMRTEQMHDKLIIIDAYPNLLILVMQWSIIKHIVLMIGNTAIKFNSCLIMVKLPKHCASCYMFMYL